MKKTFFSDKFRVVLWCAFIVYSLIQGCCLILGVDDIWWYNIDTLSDLLLKYNQNGRFFTNIITYFICHSFVLRVGVYLVVFLIFLRYLSKHFLPSANGKKSLSEFLAIGVIFLSPWFFNMHIYTWISGFTNYMISLIFSFVYLLHIFLMFDEKPLKEKATTIILWFILGLCGSLCVENISLYHLCLSIFAGAFALVKYRKVRFSDVAFLFGTLIGIFFMFSGYDYVGLAKGIDSDGIRSMDFQTTELFTKLYTKIIENFSRRFFIFHIILVGSLIILFSRRFANSDKKPKYSVPCIVIMLFYAVFSLYSTISEEPLEISPAFKIRALESAFTFMYLIALVYMVSVTFSGSRRIRSLVYLLSTVVVTAPFLVANPVSARCFYADYVFWGLFTFDLLAEILTSVSFGDIKTIKTAAAAMVCGFTFVFSFINISNKVVDIIRIDYIKEQMAENTKTIEYIELPYSMYAFDPIEMIKKEETYGHLEKNGVVYSYPQLLCMTNDIDVSMLDKTIIYISVLDYNIKER